MCVLAQTIYTPISNIGQQQGGAADIGGNSIAAQSFTTAGATSCLANISLMLDPCQNGITLGSFNCSLYTDSGGSPGSCIAILAGDNFPAFYGYGICNFSPTNTSPLELSANTTYWIVASSPDSTGFRSYPNPSSFYVWSSVFTNKLDSGSTWTLGTTSFSNGGGWLSGGSYPSFQFSISVTNPLPPSVSIFQPIVLNFSNPGFSFVLQENSDLATTNWGTATEAIQLSTVSSNQIVFIVPPERRQMFFRLIFQ